MVVDSFSQNQDKYLSVSDLSNIIKANVEQTLPNVYVKGEVSGLKIASSGHCFFTLKDSNSAISACIWKSSIPSVKAGFGDWSKFVDGVQVLAECHLSVYQRNTSISIVISKMQLAGIGELAAKFEALKAKLAAEGLFEQSRKKPLPEYPTTVGIVSANTAAGKGDMVKILYERSAFLRVVLFPTSVQGDAAVPQIIRAINCATKHYINNTEYKPDVLIIGRGGGAIEDMWCFNDEQLARTIADCPIPTVTGIGHEQDFTIADFVADYRASTPSNAAEIVTRNTVGLVDTLNACNIRLHGKMNNIIENLQNRLTHCTSDRLKKIINNKYNNLLNDFNFTQQRFLTSKNKYLDEKKNILALLAGRLQTLSPLNVLARGYAIVEDDEGHLISQSSQTSSGQKINITVKNGKIRATVD